MIQIAHLPPVRNVHRVDGVAVVSLTAHVDVYLIIIPTQTTAHVLKAGTLRYPGGNLADWWDWRTGWCVPETTTSGCEALKNPCASKQHRKVYKVREVWWQLYILLDVCIRTLYTHVAIQPPPIPIEI